MELEGSFTSRARAENTLCDHSPGSLTPLAARSRWWWGNGLAVRIVIRTVTAETRLHSMYRRIELEPDSSAGILESELDFENLQGQGELTVFLCSDRSQLFAEEKQSASNLVGLNVEFNGGQR